jgi:thiol-disulfide isomerase/thioredoxin
MGTKHKIFALLALALITTSIFSGAVLATSVNNTPVDTNLLEQVPSYTGSQTSNSLNHSLLNSKIDSFLKASKPVFVFFYTANCHFCMDQKPIIDELEQEYADKITFIRVNGEDDLYAMNEFGVRGFPAMFLIVDKNEEGYVYREFDGFTQKEVLKNNFDFVVENGSLPEDIENHSSQEVIVNPIQIVSQEELDNDEFFKEVEDDEDFNWAYEYINNKSDYQLKNSIKEIYADGSVGIFATFISESEDGKTINLIRASKGNKTRSVLMKIETTNLTILDRDGSVTIDTLNGSVISAGGLYSGGDGPNWVDCTIAGIGDWVSFVTIVAGIPFCYVACAGVLAPDPAELFEIAECLVCAGSVAVVSIGRPMVQCLLNNCAYGEECKDRNQIIEEPYCYDANTVVWRYCSNDCKIEPGIKHCLSGCSNGKCNEDDPGGDRPDDSFDVSDAFYPKSSRSGNSFKTTSCVAILSRGFDTSLALLLTEFNEPSVLIDQDFSPSIVDDYPILAIPSGGLYGLDSSSTFKSNLEQYVRNGGTLIVFSQQHGYEYSALPRGNLSGFGWTEDQSCHYRSVYIDTYHPILSGQDSVTSDVTVDGYFTKYPENATILLSRTKNGMPAMLMYEYGNGTVIASTIYTDWAYGHHQITQDGKNLVRNIIAWAKYPKNIPEFAPEDTVIIPINITNCGNATTDKVFFSITSPTTTVNYTIMNLSLLPNETKTVNFTYAAPSELGIWSIDYFLLINLSVQHGTEKFAVSKYAENPEGFVYQGKDITFTISSPEE